MADKNQNSPAASFSEMVTQWERNFDAFANQVMGTDAYSQAMNEMQKSQLGLQKLFAQSMTQQLATLNLPSREDIVHLTDLVHQLDRRLERIEERFALNDRPKSKRKRPPRTKTPKKTDQDDAGDKK